MPNPARTLAIAGLLLAPLAVPVITPGAASAATDGTQVVIMEVYGAGGNSGALYNRDFVELYNGVALPATVDQDNATVNLSGRSTRTPGRLARPRAGQRRGARDREGRARVEHQLGGVGGAGIVKPTSVGSWSLERYAFGANHASICDADLKLVL